MICHLAVIHGELRNVMEKDERLTKEFIKNVFYDVDLKKLEESGADIPSPQKSPEKPTRDEQIKENNVDNETLSREHFNLRYEPTASTSKSKV